MIRLYAFCCILFSLFLGVSKINAQISQGGGPMQVFELKSSINKVVEMPVFAQWMVANEIKKEGDDNGNLKPFRFAYPFEVRLTTENSGEWYQVENGWRVWKLTIRSEGAKSLNLIFDEFKLPDNARLFIYNENSVLGAFTSYNNKSSGKFAIAPISGDEITVQYEVQDNKKSSSPFIISKVNHDFVGINEKSDRRPLDPYIAGECNVDINCEIGQNWNEVKNSVCRIIVDGREVCSGVLVNNTAEDQKPYVLSAAHCYDKKEYAETSVYVFSFESPFCAPLDGDPSNSVAGAVMKATFDSLDFALTELSLVPPPEYLAYYAGWDRKQALPSSSASIHHPWGMIKKIAIDEDPSVIANFSTSSGYLKNGFLKILRWENGVTEPGSSGGPLFNSERKLVGTLTGGDAVCDNPVNDYFERFALSWDYKSDTSKQLKYWLDPINTNVDVLDGKQFNTGENLCGSFTNLKESDDYSLVTITEGGSFAGYWGGSNSVGITEFMERFAIPGEEQLSGVSLGIGKLKTSGINNQSKINIKVYNGNSKPEELIYSQTEKIKGLAQDAMNFFGFSEAVLPADTFFVGFELSGVQAADSFAVYQSLRYSYEEDNFWLKKSGEWFRFKDVNPSGKSMTNIIELVACNIDDFTTDTLLVNNPKEILIYPNPVQSAFLLEAGQNIPENSISVFNLIGQEIGVNIEKVTSRKANIDMTGNIPGIYLVRFKRDDGYITRKISFVPW